jgi:Uma2 family endonuclease
MASTAAKQEPLMTVDEFFGWRGCGTGRIWELADGVPRAQDPASDIHGTIQGNLGILIGPHLAKTRPHCRLVTNPGIEPRLNARWNHRIPELGVTCTSNQAGMRRTPDPLLLVEVLSASNARDTWGNIALYATVPSVMEILVVDSTKIEVQILRRGADGVWPKNVERLVDGAIHLQTIDFAFPLADAYRNTYLAG